LAEVDERSFWNVDTEWTNSIVCGRRNDRGLAIGGRNGLGVAGGGEQNKD
jgi:hypothetical protein